MMYQSFYLLTMWDTESEKTR